MGFGTRTDYRTGRALDLNATYEGIIKPAVEKAGLDCTRADEISDSGVIDRQMFEQLLTADVVIADLSTSNVNAVYELGVRHALRPRSTVIVAEQEMQSQGLPFDLSHVKVLFYEHLGRDIGAREVARFGPELTKACRKALESPRTDSPVYTFLSSLKAPEPGPATAPHKQAQRNEPAPRVSATIAEFEKAKRAGDYGAAKAALQALRESRANDHYLIQQLAYITYLHRDSLDALNEAKELLGLLEPETTNDTQTLGLWGAVHKRLWEISRDQRDLETSIRAYERGFALRNDHYNGINLAYMLNVRSSLSAPAFAIADFVRAERTRAAVERLCRSSLSTIDESSEDVPWLYASLAEALLGRGDLKEAQRWKKKAFSLLKTESDVTNIDKKFRHLQSLLSESPLRLIQKE